jgi:hypothetical protein
MGEDTPLIPHTPSQCERHNLTLPLWEFFLGERGNLLLRTVTLPLFSKSGQRL